MIKPVFERLNDDFIDECAITKYNTQRAHQGFFTMKFGQYNSLGILPEILKELLSPFDYFEIKGGDTKGFYQILPETTFLNSNIKACNFQQAEGFQNFDSQLEDKDLTATNLTAVDLTNSSFNGCKLVGTVFQVADVKGVDFRNCTVNNNTDFENAFNTEIVPHQKER